jgi:20S proteasome subunit beta 2
MSSGSEDEKSPGMPPRIKIKDEEGEEVSRASSSQSLDLEPIKSSSSEGDTELLYPPRESLTLLLLFPTRVNVYSFPSHLTDSLTLFPSTNYTMDGVTGFDFSLYPRNCSLDSKGFPSKTKKTGTTIAAVIFDGGVVLGADTRATEGPIVAVKEEEKIHYIADNILALGAGTAADTDQVTELCSAKLRLFQLNTGMQPRVEQAAAFLVNQLFPYGGHVQASLILGGVDFKGPSVYGLTPDGCLAAAPFGATGSGFGGALSVLESRWAPGMKEEEAKELVADAIEAGITTDLGSGSNVNLAVITAEGTKWFRKYRVTNQRPFRLVNPVTAIEVEVVKESSRPIAVQDVHLEILDGAEEQPE